MIKILQIVGEPIGGIRKHIHSIIKNIDDQKFNIYYGYSTTKCDYTFVKDMQENKKSISKILELSVLKKPHLSDIKNLILLIKFVRLHNIQIVHGHGAKGGLYARLLKLFCNVKTVYTPHGGVLHQAFTPLMDKIYGIIEKMMMPFTDVLLFESNYSKTRYFDKIGVPKCEVIINYNGVSIEGIKTSIIPHILLKKKASEKHIGIFARLHPMKGQSLAIDVIALLPENYYLHLFGEGEEYEFLLDKVRKLSLHTRIFFHGEINNTEEVMQSLDCVLIPSVFESFSYTAAEALMMGIPVIASNVGGLKEVLAEESGVLVDEMTPLAFKEAVHKLFSDSQYKSQLICNGKARYKKHFNEKSMVYNISKVYDALLQNPTFQFKKIK